MSSANCVSCLTSLPLLSLYQCHTCSIEQKEASSAETLCEDCLVPHLRKEHSIVDSKGKKPLACTTHKFLFSNFCKTCDVLFCCKCSATHKKHDYETIEKKATEIRTQVFRLLTELENKEKPVRLKNESTSNIVNKNAEDAKQFSVFVQEQLKLLEKSILQDVDQKSKSNRLHGQNLSKTCLELVETQQCLRKLLSDSNSKLIQTCATDLSKADKIIKLCDELVQQKELTVSFTSKEVAKQKFEAFGNEIKLASKTVRKSNFFNIVNRQQKHFRIGDSGSNKKEIIEILVNEEENEIEFKLHRFCEKTSLITYAFPLFDTLSFIVLFSDRSARMYRYRFGESDCGYPENENFLWPFEFCSRVHWSYWDSENSIVKFTHNNYLFVKCKKLPKINMTSSIPGYLCFIDENDKRILLFAISSGSLIKIELEQLKLESVDCVSVIAEDEICVWSIISKKLQFFRKNFPWLRTFSLYWSLSWDNQQYFISAGNDLHSYTMIPRVERDSDLLEDHLFAIWKERKEEQPKVATVKNPCECDICGKLLQNKIGVSHHKRAVHGWLN